MDNSSRPLIYGKTIIVRNHEITTDASTIKKFQTGIVISAAIYYSQNLPDTDFLSTIPPPERWKGL